MTRKKEVFILVLPIQGKINIKGKEIFSIKQIHIKIRPGDEIKL